MVIYQTNQLKSDMSSAATLLLYTRWHKGLEIGFIWLSKFCHRWQDNDLIVVSAHMYLTFNETSTICDILNTPWDMCMVLMRFIHMRLV